jgi:purine-binding chemotaxis protein CheW
MESTMSNEQGVTAATGRRDGSRQYATFSVADLFFGINVTEVQEVLRYQEMTGVPLAPPVIEGLINLRGQIVTALDMRRRLSLEPRQSGSRPMNMVVRSDDGPVSLLVDEIGDVLEVQPEQFESLPDNLNPALRHLMEGVYKLDNRLLLVLDREKVLQV